jgi:hypothetical protein
MSINIKVKNHSSYLKDSFETRTLTIPTYSLEYTAQFKQRATLIIVGWFVGLTWTNIKWCTQLCQLLFTFYSTYIIKAGGPWVGNP